jgi:hypothetical protein
MNNKGKRTFIVLNIVLTLLIALACQLEKTKPASLKSNDLKLTISGTVSILGAGELTPTPVIHKMR